MHEGAIADQIITEANEQGLVLGITVEVGDLAHLPAKDLDVALKARVDWNIEIIEKKAHVKCSCGYEGEPKIIEKRHELTLFECPKCGNIPQIIDGDQIILKEVQVE